MKEANSSSELSTELISALDETEKSFSINQIKLQLDAMNPSEIAHVIESSPPYQRKLIWSLLDHDEEGEILTELHDEIQQELLLKIDSDDLIEIISNLEIDDIVDILQVLPQIQVDEFLSKVSSLEREKIRTVMDYPEDSAGGLMNTDIISVRPRHSLEVVMRFLRLKKALPKNTDKIFVVSKNDQYLGDLSISKIVVSEPTLSVRELMETDALPIDANMNDKEVSILFEQNDLISAPVIDENSKLVGRITVDDVVDVIREDADQNLMSITGIAEDTFAAPARAARSRVVWLSINLITAFIAAMTINLFESTIDKLVYLAVLMPIVASMGGVAATQTLTIVIRGLTLQQINKANIRWLFKRELVVSIINGVVLSVAIGGITFLWFQEAMISILICVAMTINLISSVIAGMVVPIVLRRLNQDPAIAGSVVVTTVTDVVGFFSFLGLATIFLIN